MYKSRKFQFTIFLSLVYTGLLVLKYIEPGIYAGLMGSLVPLYFAANVGQKVWAPPPMETVTVGSVSQTRPWLPGEPPPAQQ